MDLSKLIEGLKLPPRYLFAAALASGLLLFGGRALLATMGLDRFVVQYRPWIGIAFLLSAALWVSHGLAPSAARAVKRVRLWRAVRKLTPLLHDLTPREKAILAGYVYNNTRTQTLSMLDGAVQGLEAQKILYRSSTLGRGPNAGFDYNIQPWAWDYLRKHPEILEIEEIP